MFVYKCTETIEYVKNFKEYVKKLCFFSCDYGFIYPASIYLFKVYN